MKSKTCTQSKQPLDKSQSSKFCQSGVKQTHFGEGKKKVVFDHSSTLKTILIVLPQQHVEVDADGKLSLHQLTNLLESVVDEQSGLPRAVVNIYKHEIAHLK